VRETPATAATSVKVLRRGGSAMADLELGFNFDPCKQKAFASTSHNWFIDSPMQSVLRNVSPLSSNKVISRSLA
jgi:hypothetical protein